MAVAADSSAGDIASALADLAAAIDGLTAEIDVLAGSMDELAASSGTAATSVAATGDAATVASADVVTLGDAIGALSAAVDDLMGSITPLLTTLGSLIAIMGLMTIINDVSSWIENLIQQMFQLDEQTQKVINSWQYLFAETGVVGSGSRNAANLADWAFQESPKLPFTAMDLRGAMTVLGTSPDTPVAGQVSKYLGMDPAEVEQFLPYLADLASTMGASANAGQGTSLLQAANAIRMALMGRSMELKSQLNLTPQMLMQYGLQGKVTSGGIGVHISDPQSLYSSIENFVIARGLKGAAQEQETNTFWGAYSSFQDYIQNTLMEMGGVNPDATSVASATRQGSFFGNLQQLLIHVNTALGQSMLGKGPLAQVTGATGNILGGLTSAGGSLLTGIFGGGAASGAGQILGDVLKDLEHFGNWLSSHHVQEDVQKIGEAIGEFFGANLQSAKSAMPDFINDLKQTGESFQFLWAQVTPAQRESLKSILGDILEVTGFIAEMVGAFAEMAGFFLGATNKITSMAESWGVDLREKFQEWGRDFIDWLIKGIESQMSNFEGVVGKIANIPKSILGHSRPTQGPLVDDDQWMPDMMAMFAEGIQRGIPAVARASQQAAAALGAPMAMAGHVLGGGGISNTTYGPTTNYGGSTSYNSFYGNSMAQLENAIQVALADMDRKGALVFAAPGGHYLFGMH